MDELITQARKMCHEFNQPLTVLMARSELVLLKMAPEDPNRKAIAQIHEQADKLSSLVEDMRNLFKSYQEE